MSAVGTAVGLAATGLIIGGVGAGIYGATGGFGEDAANAADQAMNAELTQNTNAQGAIQQGTADGQGRLDPYANAGSDAIAQQRALAGLDGPEAQQRAIMQLEQSPQFQAMLAQGEEALLQNQSATGGLRGGDTQRALMEGRQGLLAQVIQQQLGTLGGFAANGQNAATQQGVLGMQGAGTMANLFQDRGAIRAGGIIGQTAARLQGRQQAFQMGTQVAGTAAQLATGAPVGGVVPPMPPPTQGGL